MRQQILIRDESGSALVVALILVLVWSVAIMAILGFAEAGFGVATGADEERDVVYAADGGAESAITHLANGGSIGACPSFRYETSATTHIATVSCVNVTSVGESTTTTDAVSTSTVIEGPTTTTADVPTTTSPGATTTTSPGATSTTTVPKSEEPGPVVVDLAIRVDGESRLDVRVELVFPPEPDPEDPEPAEPEAAEVTVTRWDAMKT
jgi:hypothetical protein